MLEPEPQRRREWWRFATVDITPLRRHRDFRLLFVGRLVSFFGTMITYVAVPFQVYQLSHSTLLVGLLGLVELAALLVFAMLGGALADAADRRLMVLLSEAGLMVGSVVLAGNSALAHPQLWVIFGVVCSRGRSMQCSAPRSMPCPRASSSATSSWQPATCAGSAALSA